MTPESLYVHVPFCMSKCPYCDFNSMPYDESLAGRYLQALRKEAAMRTEGTLKTLYVGGGTPTVLPPQAIREVFSAVYATCALAPGAEVTCEANPGTLDKEKIDVLIECGVNRISLGVQSLNEPELRTLGRSHSADDARHAMELVSESEAALSVDLIYGIPRQDTKGLEKSIEEVLSYSPAHVSAYELTPEEGTPLMEVIGCGLVRMPHEEEVLEMAETCAEALGRAGYEHYEISNYALPGMRSRHNMNYWVRGDYIGLGPGAHSLVSGERAANTGYVFDYVQLLSDGLLPIEESSELTEDEKRREYVFLGLRLLEGLDAGEAFDRYGLDLLRASEALAKKGLIVRSNERVRLSPKGMRISNTSVAELIGELGL